MSVRNIIGDEYIEFTYQRKKFLAYIVEGSTIWEVYIRRKGKMILDGISMSKKIYKTSREALDKVIIDRMDNLIEEL